MQIRKTRLPELYEFAVEPIYDERGAFCRVFDRHVFETLGLNARIEQMSLSSNRILGTLRGLHWQAEPGQESKVVRVTRGRIFDVVVDLRVESPSFGAWASFELSARTGNGLFIPPRFAHGFMTLEDDTEVLYQMNEVFRPELARTLRWDDPELSIEWPIAPRSMSTKDAVCETRLSDLVRRRAA